MNEIREMTAKRICILMDKHKKSQAQLARESELSKGTINKAVKNGELSIKSAKRIAAVFGVSLDYLYGNSNIESERDCAFAIVERHIGTFSHKMSGTFNGIVAGISLSKRLGAYIEQSAEIKRAPLPEHIKKEVLKEVRQAFLQEIENDVTEKRNLF